jgi:hypothetical protein
MPRPRVIRRLWSGFSQLPLRQILTVKITLKDGKKTEKISKKKKKKKKKTE